MRTSKIKLLAGMSVLLIAWSPWAQADQPTALLPHVMTGIASGNLLVRSSPPSGIFNLKGGVVGTVLQGQEVVVKDARALKNFFGSENWLEVEVSDGENNSIYGWVYNGITEDGKCYIDFEGCLALAIGKTM